MPQPPTDARILLLLNPGRQSRHYLVGLTTAAARGGIPCLSLELGPIWQQASGPDSERVRASARRQIAELVHTQRITHAIGYVFNGTHDLGLSGDGERGFRTIWDETGVQAHPPLDGPSGMGNEEDGQLDDPLHRILGGEHRMHILKSESASAEAAGVLGWPNVRAMTMAKDYGAIRPTEGVETIHDAVAIVGDAAAPPIDTIPFLDEDDPEPARSWMRQCARTRNAHGGRWSAESMMPLMRAWLDLKQERPAEAFWRLAGLLGPVHGASIAWLRSERAGGTGRCRRCGGWSGGGGTSGWRGSGGA